MILSNILKVSYHILRSIDMKVSLLVWIQQKNIASELDIQPIFPTKRQRKRKKYFDEQDDQDETWTSLEESTF